MVLRASTKSLFMFCLESRAPGDPYNQFGFLTCLRLLRQDRICDNIHSLANMLQCSSHLEELLLENKPRFSLNPQQTPRVQYPHDPHALTREVAHLSPGSRNGRVPPGETEFSPKRNLHGRHSCTSIQPSWGRFCLMFLPVLPLNLNSFSPWRTG